MTTKEGEHAGNGRDANVKKPKKQRVTVPVALRIPGLPSTPWRI